MCSPEKKPPLIVIVGPTAVGKTKISLKLAERFNGEIISGDSRLFYRGMDIGTAKPSAGERQIIPHHLIDVANPDETWSLALFQKAARDAIYKIHLKGKLPFLVGGTGQFIRAIIEEWSIPPASTDGRLREALTQWAAEIGPDELHKRLAVIDPESAARIDARNVRRTIRAIEVSLATGVRFSLQRRKLNPSYDLLILGLCQDRIALFARIDARIDAMIANGFIDEVRNLLAQGYSADLPSFSAIGYREIANYLNGEITLEDALVKIKHQTHQFVRRQANWFKPNDPRILWFPVDDQTILQMEIAIRGWLSSRGLA